MRSLATSRAWTAVLVALYLLACQAAIPVPKLMLKRLTTSETAHSAYCACTGCSPDACCCAMGDATEDDADSSGVTMLGYNCQGTLSWFLVALPPAIPDLHTIVARIELPRLVVPATVAVLVSAELAVPTPPPRTAA
jgi:hypothetical protein